MKLKKLLSVALVVAMVLSTMTFTALAEVSTSVAKIGDTEFATLDEAIHASADGGTITLLANCAIADITVNPAKKITFEGINKEVVLSSLSSGYRTFTNTEFTFRNITLAFPNGIYQGIQSKKITIDDCIVNGILFGYAESVVVTNTTFNQDAAESYNVWTYGSDMTFTNCRFNSKGRSLLIYNEGGSASKPQKVSFTDCSFYASEVAESKAAIEIDSSLEPDGMYVTVDNCTATGFDNVGQAPGLVHNKKGDYTTLILDGLQIIPTIVAEVDGTFYASLLTAITAAKTGNKTVKLLDDITLVAEASTGYGLAGIIIDGITLDGDGYTLTVEGATSTWDCAIYTRGGTIKNLTINKGFRGVFTGGQNSDIIIDNVTIGGSTYTISADGANSAYSLIVSNSTFNGWTSYTNGFKSVSFTNCTFGKGEGYAFMRPYNPTTYVDCKFEAGYSLDATKTGGNKLIDCTVDGVVITPENVATLLGANAATVEVINNVAIIGETRYTSLDDAIAAAIADDTIIVFPGEYETGFILNKNNVNIEGSLDNNGNYLTVFKDTCKVAGSNNTVKNIKVSVDSEIRLNIVGATNITVENCWFDGIGNNGVSALGAASGTIKDNKFTNCSKGIYIYTPGVLKIENNIIENALYGIHIETFPVTSSVTIEGNDIDCSWANSFGDGTGNLLITKNTFRSISPYYTDQMQAGSVNAYSDKTVVTENYFAEHAAIRLQSNANENGIAIKNNYFKDGIENAFFDTAKPCSVYPYYSDEAMTKLVYAPANATDSEIVDVIASNTFTTASANATVEIIKDLSTEAQKNLPAQKIEEIIAAKGTPVTAPTVAKASSVATMDSNISATVTPVAGSSGNIILDSGENEVYSVIADEGTETDVDKTSTPILIKIKATKLIEKVLHEHNGVIKEIPFTQDPVTFVVTFAMNEFSNIALVPAVAIPVGNAKLSFVPSAIQEEGKAIYDLVLTGDQFDTVKNFVAGEFVAILTGTGTKPFEYVIEPINNEISVYYDEVTGGRKYHVNLKEFIEGSSYSAIADSNYPNGVVIAKMTVDGYGNGSITASDILMQKHDGLAENLAATITTIMGENAVFNIAVPTRNLAVNVEFNNIIDNNINAYQDMKVLISGGDLIDEIVYDLGNDFAGVTWNTNAYSVSTDLTLNTMYTVTVSGAGYRTARYTVNMADDRVLNFWNNVKDLAINVEEGNGASAKDITFLAGDIVKDNNINLYDLSAVVSYFGMINLNSDTSTYKYAKYDLNRDGKVDSKDVAYVLVSWDN